MIKRPHALGKSAWKAGEMLLCRHQLVTRVDQARPTVLNLARVGLNGEHYRLREGEIRRI